MAGGPTSGLRSGARAGKIAAPSPAGSPDEWNQDRFEKGNGVPQTNTATDGQGPITAESSHHPVLSRLFSGTFWLALRTPLQILFGLMSLPLIVGAIGEDMNGAYQFAWNFGFFQILLEFGMGSALARRVSEAWTRGDRAGVDRAVAAGLLFYGVMTFVQMASLVGVIFFAVPNSGYEGPELSLVIRLIWLQVFTAPCYGLTLVISSVLQAARRFEVIPRFEFAILILRFAILAGGLWLEIPFFLIVVAMTLSQILLVLGPATVVLVREVGYVPRLDLAEPREIYSLLQVSFWVFMFSLSMILADRLDTMVLGFALADPGPATTVYSMVGKPFLVISQTAWMLAGLIMPAAASLAAAADTRGLDRLKYDGSRFLTATVAVIATLAWMYAGPFLSVWMGPEYSGRAGLMRLFLFATLPLILVAPIQMAVGMGHVRTIALTALFGAACNLVVSLALTLAWQDVSGVIWGTVVTAILSNLVIPAWYLRERIGLSLRRFAKKSLLPPLAGSAAAVLASLLMQALIDPAPDGASRAWRGLLLLAHLAAAAAAFAAGYASTSVGRQDVGLLSRYFLGGRAPAPRAVISGEIPE